MKWSFGVVYATDGVAGCNDAELMADGSSLGQCGGGSIEEVSDAEIEV
jgi:hypothetical protein